MIKIRLLILIGFLSSSILTKAQNCGLLDSVTYSIVDNGNGTSNYTFVGYFSTTSGGSKSVDISIYCGSHYFVTNDCVGTTTSQITKTYGPYNNVSNCAGTIFIDWIGKTNASCGGSTCGGATGITPVPVKLVSFVVERDDGIAQLTWKTASELNNDRFEIQRKLESETEFKTIGEVGGSGNSNQLMEYEYVDDINLVKGKICYRLKQVDYDNAYALSNVHCLEEKVSSDIIIYPNPTRGEILIVSNLEGFSYTACNSVGQIIQDGQTDETKAHVDLTKFPKGIYYLSIKNAEGSLISIQRIAIIE